MTVTVADPCPAAGEDSAPEEVVRSMTVESGDDRVERAADAELIARVRDGLGPESTAAFGELYSRHHTAARILARQLARSPADADDLVAGAFTRLLEILRSGRGPTEAFRAYLLTAVRHLAYDRTRAERRVEVTDDIGDVLGIDPERTIVPFTDPALAGLERSLAARAFATLPERWQAVLWHLEVEGDSPADIAPLLGLSPNAVSALGYRAREGLRQAYLQEHLASGSGRWDRQHRDTSEKLGAYTRGGLARRNAVRVEAHLAECEECRSLTAELREVNAGMLRAVVAPLVLGAGLVGYLASRGDPAHLALGAGTGEFALSGGGLTGALGVLGALGAAGVLGVAGLTGVVSSWGGAVPAAPMTAAPSGFLLPPAPGAGVALPPTTLPPVALPPVALPPAVLPPAVLPPAVLPPAVLPPTALAPTALAPTPRPPSEAPARTSDPARAGGRTEVTEQSFPLSGRNRSGGTGDDPRARGSSTRGAPAQDSVDTPERAGGESATAESAETSRSGTGAGDTRAAGDQTDAADPGDLGDAPTRPLPTLTCLVTGPLPVFGPVEVACAPAGTG